MANWGQMYRDQERQQMARDQMALLIRHQQESNNHWERERMFERSQQERREFNQTPTDYHGIWAGTSGLPMELQKATFAALVGFVTFVYFNDFMSFWRASGIGWLCASSVYVVPALKKWIFG